MDANTRATQILALLADDETIAKADQLVLDGTAQWIERAGGSFLVLLGAAEGHAYVGIEVDAENPEWSDFEVSDRF